MPKTASSASCSGQPALLTYTRRFAEALCVMCGELPSAEMCNAWLWEDDEALQDWVGARVKLEWVQAIGAIDGARKLAEQCEEGRPDFITFESERLLRRLASGEAFPVKFARGMWRPAVAADKAYWEGVVDARSSGLVSIKSGEGNKHMLEHTSHSANFVRADW